MENRVMIGMSGGVDSSVAAYLLQQQGFSCVGATMELYHTGSQDALDAAAVAQRLGIAHHVFPLEEEFEKQVIAPFADAYAQGLTPNPCIRCNHTMKFGRLMALAEDLGCQYVASGHYARIRRDEKTGRYLLYKALDSQKDQTYFLACLTQQQLSRIQFPLGALTKEAVRRIAQENGFLNARKRDSQDICFIPGGDYGAFLERYTRKAYPDGDYLDLKGKVVGRHHGAVRYTLGQRKGLGIALGTPVYVCGKDMEKNTVTVGGNDALFSPSLRANDWIFFPFPDLTRPLRVTAKIRHSRFEAPALATPEKNGYVRVDFDDPQRAITPGQAVVLYQDDLVIGGGTIREALG